MARRTDNTTPLILAKISLPVSRLMVPAAVGLGSEVGRLLSLNEEDRSQLQMAVEEGFCNAVDHYSAQAGNNDQVHLDFFVEEDRLVISIREMGIPFDQNEADRYTPDSMEGMEKAGLGMLLLRHTMDSVELFVHGRSGKETRLTKKLRYGSLPEELANLGVRKRGTKRITVKTPETRSGREEDLGKITRLAWRCYGYTQEELLYDQELLAKKFQAGEFKPIVVFDPKSGAMIGHAGLKYHEPGSKVPEMGLAFADPGFRCPAITMGWAQVAIKLAKENGDLGIFDCSVTTHTFSQKAMQQCMRSSPCGIMFGIAAQGMQAKELATSQQEKGSVINHYLPLDRSKTTIHPPARHLAMIKEIYGWMNLPRDYETPAATPPTETTSLSAFPLPDELNVAFIVVHTIGIDAGKQMADAFTTFRREHKDAVYAFLPLGTPHSPALVERCESLGFSFSGVMPHIHDGDDRILMQWVDIPLDLDQVRVYGDMSRKLLAYVRAEKERIEGQ